MSAQLTATLRGTHSTKKHGEKAPETADLYSAYGKALLENAISQAGVLGKQDPDDSLDEKGACTDLGRNSMRPSFPWDVCTAATREGSNKNCCIGQLRCHLLACLPLATRCPP